MGFFAKSKGAGLLDDRRNDVKKFKLLLKVVFFPIIAIWWILKKVLGH